MKTRYLTFDIETAKDVPGEDFIWRPHRPLGISCAATFASDMDHPVLWHGKTPEGSPAARMSRQEAKGLIDYLVQMQSEGYKVLTWNGLGFDFDVLAEESSALELCRECALNHVDMMFHAFCVLGFPIGLDKTAQGMGLPGKPAGMSGDKAPLLWAQGKFDQVLGYVAQDVRVALAIAQSCDQRRSLTWVTRKGDTKSIPLKYGWLSVKEAIRLPLPDTSWMSTSIPRRDFTAWLSSQ